MPRLLSHLKCYAERKKWDSLESLQDDIAGRLEAVRERWGEARWGEVGCETALAGVAAEWQTGNDVEVEIKTRRECTICIALLRGDRRIIDLEIRSLESIVHLNKHSSIKRIAETTILANNSYHTFCNIFQQNAPFLSPNESFSSVPCIFYGPYLSAKQVVVSTTPLSVAMAVIADYAYDVPCVWLDAYRYVSSCVIGSA